MGYSYANIPQVDVDTGGGRLIPGHVYWNNYAARPFGKQETGEDGSNRVLSEIHRLEFQRVNFALDEEDTTNARLEHGTNRILLT